MKIKFRDLFDHRLVIDFDRLRAIVHVICGGESSVTSLTSRRVEGSVTSLVAPTYRHLFERRSFVEESVFLTGELVVTRLPKISQIGGYSVEEVRSSSKMG
jgi:hypothetical protein